MRKNRLIFFSVGISLFLHLSFLGSTPYWWIPGTAAQLEKTRKMFDVKSIPLEVPSRTQRQIVESYKEKIKFEKPGSESKQIIGQFLKDAGAVKKPETEMAFEKQTTSPEEFARQAPKLEDLSALKRDVNVKKRTVVDKDTPTEIDVVSPWEEFERKMKEAGQDPGEILEEMVAFVPQVVMTAEDGGALPGDFAGFGHGSQYESIDSVLHVSLMTYRDVRDGQGYFRLSIYPAHDIGHLEVVPKEVVFLVDSSLSIGRKRLQAFKDGIKYSLERLNPGDRFNIVAFKEEITALFDQPVTADPERVANANAFLEGLRPSERTDLYKAFLENMRNQATMLPSYMVLFSDGRTNIGVTAPEKVIGEITRTNHGERPIFCLSGGKRVNLFLLDFLAYQNRGWSEYTRDVSQLEEKIAGFYRKIRNPILLNVRFQISGLDSQEVYPKHLPDFYRETEFVLFGTFRSENKFSMRILGDINGSTKEFIFSYDLAKAAQGTEDIARQWAFNKIYHLISQITAEGYNEGAFQEIRELSRKFGIRTPYNL
ncbi:MAG: VWA domain-containing protein [Candidatus Omnitrophica bacterium]|nr:VWA domain-containing protein [Candidatus Omnitrophota bacterium]MDD5672039.1 VWA domain-containing protein [Candidatus Omnitrophota bacterium]